MTVNHDPRPASRYQAVTPSAFSQAMSTRGAGVGTLPAGAPKARVLRHVQTQVVRLALLG